MWIRANLHIKSLWFWLLLLFCPDDLILRFCYFTFLWVKLFLWTCFVVVIFCFLLPETQHKSFIRNVSSNLIQFLTHIVFIPPNRYLLYPLKSEHNQRNRDTISPTTLENGVWLLFGNDDKWICTFLAGSEGEPNS